MARDVRTIDDLDGVARAGAHQQHVAIARGDEDAAGLDQVAILGLLDRHGATGVEPAGEGGSEVLGHVLDDEHGRAAAREGFEHFAQGLGAAGGGADGDDGLGHRHAGDDAFAPIVGERRNDRIGGQLGLDLHGRSGLADAAQLGMGRALGGVADAHARFLQELGRIDAWLGHDIDGTGFHGLDQRVRAFLGKARADDDRDGALRHELAQEGDAIHARQFDVEEDDVGHFVADALDGDIGIGSRRHDFELGVGRNDLAQRHAHRGAVVHDQDSDLLAHGLGLRSSGIRQVRPAAG